MSNPAVNQGEGIGDPFDYVVCIYNPAHIIQRYKLDIHLMKCAQQHKKSHMKQCPFDTKHVIPEEMYDHHVRICPQRTMLDRVKYNVDPSCDMPLVELRAPQVEASEDWENEDYQSYNPREQASNQPHLIRKIQGAVPSDRRAFRMEQRRIFRENNK